MPRKASTPKASAGAIDRQLKRYREMRDFKVTAEPSGKPSANGRRSDAGLPFVIQKHAASHLHYDFRLGWNGVFKSWAVAKGPSYCTADKRLAVQVEDHPIEYGGFEGTIPAGQYGGGTVMLWDEGTWQPLADHADVEAGLRDGSLKFTLRGKKLRGNWTLVRMHEKAAADTTKNHKPKWLLIKEKDKFARSRSEPCVTVKQPNSVVTGRDLDQIAASEDHVWDSNKTGSGRAWHRGVAKTVASTVAPTSRNPAASRQASKPTQSATLPKKLQSLLAAAPEESLPKFVAPQLATPTATAPSSGWLHELKLDGYRLQARLHGGNVQLLTRNGLDWTHRMRDLAAELQSLPCDSALLDGEVVVLGPDGNTNFADLQAAFHDGEKKSLTYFVFDLLHLRGNNLRGLPLTNRKALLEHLLGHAVEHVRYCEHLVGESDTVFRKACDLHAEGIVSKRADARYHSGRSKDWLKRKCIHEQEFVIVGFTQPSNGSRGIGALLLGYHGENNQLIYAGRTGTGFTQKTHRALRQQMDALQLKTCPLETTPADARRGAKWVEPKLVAQVRFASWTSENLLRQASFQGLREDKASSEVRREQAAAEEAPEAAEGLGKAATKRTRTSAAKATGNSHSAENTPVRLTHPDKILDAESQLTKQQLADYYSAVAPAMLPYIADRPLSLVRCPDGVGHVCFFQKHTNAMLPPGIGTVHIPDKKTGKQRPYITLRTPEALASLAQMGVLELHPWGSKNDALERPDTIIFDLDPDQAIGWKTLASAAAEVHNMLRQRGLRSFLKTTGGKGLHVVVPIRPKQAWAQVKQFAHEFALALEKQNPSLYLTTMSKAARTGRIFVDYLRNERGATAVAPFSPRARAGMAVALPLSWNELKQPRPPRFTVSNFKQWKQRLKRDRWNAYSTVEQRLPALGANRE